MWISMSIPGSSSSLSFSEGRILRKEPKAPGVSVAILLSASLSPGESNVRQKASSEAYGWRIIQIKAWACRDVATSPRCTPSRQARTFCITRQLVRMPMYIMASL